jgi:hypothetical protein
MTVNWKAIAEAAKELARVAVLGAVSAAISWGTTKLAGLDPNSAYAIAGTLLLRFLDKYLHVNQDVPVKGLLPF